MKKILMGFVWFVIFQIFFGILAGTFLSRILSSEQVAPFGILAALICAVIGTVTEKLPGTKTKHI